MYYEDRTATAIDNFNPTCSRLLAVERMNLEPATVQPFGYESDT